MLYYEGSVGKKKPSEIQHGKGIENPANEQILSILYEGQSDKEQSN